jgi:hypothetical protein
MSSVITRKRVVIGSPPIAVPKHTRVGSHARVVTMSMRPS